MPRKKMIFSESIGLRMTKKMRDMLESEADLRGINLTDLIRYKLSESLMNSKVIELLGQAFYKK